MKQLTSTHAAVIVIGLLVLGTMAGTLFLAYLYYTAPADRYGFYQSGGRFSGSAPCPSYDGRILVFGTPETGQGDIYSLDLESGVPTRLTDSAIWEGNPRLSRDGSTLVFVRECDVHGQLILKDLHSGAERTLTPCEADYIRPILLPDGSAVLATRYFEEDHNRVGLPLSAEIVIIDLSTGREQRLTNNSVFDSAIDVSDDGSLIAFERNDMPHNVWVMDVDGGNQRRVCTGSSPKFMPGATQFVFNSGQYAQEISIVNLDGTGQRLIYSSRAHNANPRCDSSGTIYFLSEPDGRGVGAIMSLDPATGAVAELHRTD